MFYGENEAASSVLAHSRTTPPIYLMRDTMIESFPARDFTGETCGNLKIIKFDSWHVQPSGQKKSKWLCECSCGNLVKVQGGNLRPDHTTSCGCVQKLRTSQARKSHGMSESLTYKSWLSMKERCTCPSSKTYPDYGGSGVTVCDRWLQSFENFLEDMGERPEGTSINRINGAKVYSKENCEWANRSIQGYDQKKRCTNTPGRTGVYFIKVTNNWAARITKDNKQIHLGFFDDFSVASQIREAEEIKLFGWAKNG